MPDRGIEVMSLSGAEESAQKPETDHRRRARSESERLMMKISQEQNGKTA
jgi:hypothetical protein